MKRTGLKKYEYADVEHFTSKAGLRFRKIMNKSWHIFLKLGTTRKIHIVDYPQLQKGKNYIFACNHSFDEDVISTLYAIDRNAYVLNGSTDQTEHRKHRKYKQCMGVSRVWRTTDNHGVGGTFNGRDVPITYSFEEQLPLTDVGKIDVAEVRAHEIEKEMS